MGSVSRASLDQKLAMAKRCSREGVMAGAKAAVVASIATAIPTLASVKMLPWARSNLNPTAQALIISSVAGAAYFIVADKTFWRRPGVISALSPSPAPCPFRILSLATARKNSFQAAQQAAANNNLKP
ncbi:early nodulin-93-like [Ananas comosus]|uniref:Early nodulin-93-like n=1 Tax=Ananas comosus TaxID=4615 RepID=A0A6P5FXX1_ANACO|nr:early nodulin-93-like [Ananas comosus]